MPIKTAQTSPEILEINSLTEEIERRQVKLSPDVRTYLNEETEKLTAKLMKEQGITKEDMAFVEEVRMWIEMPEEWQEKLPSIEEMKQSEEMEGITPMYLFEANKRHISLKQWLDLLHVVEVQGRNKEWIDETFIFPGGGEIVAEGLVFHTRPSLTHLPENLKINHNLLIYGCLALRHLPRNLKVGGEFNLGNTLNKKVKKDAKRLEKEGKIKGGIVYI